MPSHTMTRLTAAADIYAPRITAVPGSVSRVADRAVLFGRSSPRAPNIAAPCTVALPTLTAAPTASKAATLNTTILARRTELHGNRFVAVATRAVSTLTTKVHASYARYVALSASSPLVAQNTPASVGVVLTAAYGSGATLLAGVWIRLRFGSPDGICFGDGPVAPATSVAVSAAARPSSTSMVADAVGLAAVAANGASLADAAAIAASGVTSAPPPLGTAFPAAILGRAFCCPASPACASVSSTADGTAPSAAPSISAGGGDAATAALGTAAS